MIFVYEGMYQMTIWKLSYFALIHAIHLFSSLKKQKKGTKKQEK